MSSTEEIPLAEKAKTIKAINRDTVHKICSGQVVLSLAIAVKELVENALDAGATTVEVKVREFGLESVEVSDNGSGVEECNFVAMTAKYHTSKLREFIDLETVETFGFRGEALSSLCALSDMKIVTKHSSVNVATKLDVNHRGEIVKRAPCARPTGTTVTLSNLFASLPVRRREFQRNIQKEFAKMAQILQGYGLISYGKRIILTNITSKSGKSTIMSTNGSHSMIDNIVAIFGAKQNANLLKIRQPIEQNEVLTQDVLKSLDASLNLADDDLDKLGLNQFQFDGYVSSCTHGCGRSARDRQYFFVNGRPCDPKSVVKVANDVYHRYNPNQNPFIVLNVILERKDVDVNVTPDKRQVMVNNETILRLALKKSLLSTFGNIPSTFKMENQTLPSLVNSWHQVKAESESKIPDNASDNSSTSDESERRIHPEKANANKFANMLTQWRMTGKTDEPCSQKVSKRKNEPLDEIFARNFKMKRIQEYLSQDVQQKEDPRMSYKSESDSDTDANSDAKVGLEDNLDKSSDGTENFTTKNVDAKANPSDQDYRIDCKVKAIDTTNKILKVYTPVKSTTEFLKKFQVENVSEHKEAPEKVKELTADPADLEDDVILIDDVASSSAPASQPKKVATLSTSIDEIKMLMEREAALRIETDHATQVNRMKFKTKIDPKQNQSAEQELKTEISKEDFVRMEIIGQFNLGFIIVRLGEDLFIVDQHATDEKYNFETLQQTLVLQHQPLVVPQDLDMTAVNEIILIDNLKVFEANGFRFDIDMERPVTKRIKLAGKPYSRNWEFGKEDIDELVFMLQEGTSDAAYLDTCRPSRVRAMFASRACRSSVMIGTALPKTEMRRLIDHMGIIDQPWNCPHGRPTIRHLLNLNMLKINDDQNANDKTEDI